MADSITILMTGAEPTKPDSPLVKAIARFLIDNAHALAGPEAPIYPAARAIAGAIDSALSSPPAGEVEEIGFVLREIRWGRGRDEQFPLGEKERTDAATIISALDSHRSARLHEPLPPQTEEEVDAECERILTMSEEELDAELRRQGLNPEWEAERARIIAKCAIWHHERSSRQAIPSGLAGELSDVLSHRNSWLNAMRLAQEKAAEIDPETAESYWAHERKTLNRVADAIRDALRAAERE